MTTPTRDESQAAVLQAAVDSYLAMIVSIGRSAADLCPPIGTALQETLLRLRQRLAFAITPESLDESRHTLDSDLQDFAERAAEYFQRRTDDVSQILELVDRATDSFELRDQFHMERFRELARDLDGAAAALPEDESGPRLARLANDVRRYLDKMREDGETALAELRAELGAIQARIVASEQAITLDPVTGLTNRREMERKLRRHFDDERPFCLLLFDIKRLREVNDRYGRQGGDQVLRQFGSKLVAQVRPGDTVARWGEDEFAVVFECTAAQAESRAKHISQWLCGRYPVTVEGRDWKTELSASVAVIDREDGEGPDKFIYRVDQALRRREPVREPLPDPEFAAFTPAR